MQIGLGVIVGQLGLGGAEQQLYHLLSGLDRHRFRPIVIGLGADPNEYWEQHITELGYPVSHIERAAGRVGRVARITSLLRSEKVEIVHSWDFHTNPYAALAGRLAGVPLRIGSMRSDYKGIPLGRFGRALGYRGLDVLVINAAKVAEQVRNLRVTRAQVRAVTNGVEVPDPITRAERSNLKSSLGLSDEHCLIGSIGRLDKNKNHAMLLRVFAALSAKWPALRLVIIGAGPLKAELLDVASKLGVAAKVRLPGSIPEAARYLPALEICCLTSYTEGMPNVVMEAAAAGVPTIATNYGSAVELIEHKTTGYLIDPDDDTGMIARVNLLLEQPEKARRMGQAGREKIRREFSIETMRAGMTQVYEDALASKGLTSRVNGA